MKKIIQEYGNSKIIRIHPSEMKIYKLKVGDIVEVEIMPEQKRRVGKTY